MSDRTHLGITILIAALALGVLGDLLLRATPWGLNIFVWTAALVAAVLLIVHWRRVALNERGRLLAVPILFFAAAIAWWDSPVLTALNLVAIGVSLAIALLRAQAGRVVLAGIMEYVLSGLIAAVNAFAGSIRLLCLDIQWKEILPGGWTKHVAPVARGLAIAIPLLLIFGGLLAAADAVFSKIIARSFDWDFTSHIAVIVWITWMVGGFLRGMLLGKEIAITAGERPRFLYLGITEIGIVLGLLDALFLGFVLVQFRYFFGGATRVQTIAGLTYAEYARSGFFELVGVAALIIPLLLIAHWLLRKENRRDERIFRILAGAQVILLFVIMGSALQRMRLYQQEYGLTELRIYTTAFMGWLALIFGWFAVTVLRGKRERFAFGAVIAGFLIIIVLQIVNPDSLIISTNINHKVAGRSFDAGYAASLSADALPVIIASLPKLEQQERCLLASRLLQRRPQYANAGWRRWNWSRVKAGRVLSNNEQSLRAISCP
jgi:hypothetical protein